MVPEITVQELESALKSNDNKLFLLDVREPSEYETCAIEGSVLVPLKTLPERLSDIPRNCKIAVHCHHGGRSARAVQFLLDQGYADVVNVKGGIHAWSIEIDRNISTY